MVLRLYIDLQFLCVPPRGFGQNVRGGYVRYVHIVQREQFAGERVDLRLADVHGCSHVALRRVDDLRWRFGVQNFLRRVERVLHAILQRQHRSPVKVTLRPLHLFDEHSFSPRLHDHLGGQLYAFRALLPPQPHANT